jgi:hypothetical protein
MTLDKQTRNNLVNLAFFQAVWFLTVISAANGLLWPGLMGLAVFFAVHRFFSVTARAEFILVVGAAFLGLVIEAVFVRTGVLLYQQEMASVAGVPLWMLVMWANFALTMNGCLSWLQGRYLLAAVLGFVGGPLSYLGGIKLGAATAGGALEFVLAAIAICYAIVTPALLFLAQRLAVSRAT